jgi:hypothetical protein
MAHQKITYALILFLAGSFLLSCRKKLSKEDTTVEWVVVNPVTNTPYVGVAVQLFLESKHNSSIQSELIFEGKTDNQGRCVTVFNSYVHSNHWYSSKVNLNWLGMEGVHYWIRKQPDVSSYSIQKDKTNVLRYEILPYAEVVWHIKNMNCQGANDTMKYRFQELFTSTYGWTEWIQNEHTIGCTNEYYHVNRISDKIVIEAEIIRANSTIEYFLDTFLVGGTTNIDTIKLYY